MAQSVVFFDMTIGGAPAGRIEMTLRGDVVPKTAEVSSHRACPPDPKAALLCLQAHISAESFARARHCSVHINARLAPPAGALRSRSDVHARM